MEINYNEQEVEKICTDIMTPFGYIQNKTEIYIDGRKYCTQYKKDGKFHNEVGPAIVTLYDPPIEIYLIDGKAIKKEDIEIIKRKGIINILNKQYE